MADNELPSPGTSLEPRVFAELVSNQTKELELRAHELALKQQQDKHTFEHAGRMLDAQVADRIDQRKHAASSNKQQYAFILGIVIASLIFLGALALNGQGQVALEILKATSYLASGAIGGFFYGKNKKPPSEITDTEEESA